MYLFSASWVIDLFCFTCLLLREPTMARNMETEITTSQQVHYQIQIRAILKCVHHVNQETKLLFIFSTEEIRIKQRNQSQLPQIFSIFYAAFCCCDCSFIERNYSLCFKKRNCYFRSIRWQILLTLIVNA